MPRHQHLIEEVGELDRLISVIASEVESERASGGHTEALLREMEEALTELRLARGVRLMWLNAQGEALPTGAVRRNAGSAISVGGWTRAGQRVA